MSLSLKDTKSYRFFLFNGNVRGVENPFRLAMAAVWPQTVTASPDSSPPCGGAFGNGISVVGWKISWCEIFLMVVLGGFMFLCAVVFLTRQFICGILSPNSLLWGFLFWKRLAAISLVPRPLFVRLCLCLCLGLGHLFVRSFSALCLLFVHSWPSRLFIALGST